MIYNRDNIDYKSILGAMKDGIERDYKDKLTQGLARGNMIEGIANAVGSGLNEADQYRYRSKIKDAWQNKQDSINSILEKHKNGEPLSDTEMSIVKSYFGGAY